MFKSTHLGRVPASLALLALVVVGLGLATVANGSAAHTSERFVVRGEDTVKDGGACPAGVCRLELVDGAFRGTPVGSGAYEGTAKLEVAKAFANGEGGVCAPISARIVLGVGTPDRLVLALLGDSCQDGSGDVTASSFTNVARFVIKHGTGAYSKASGSGMATFSEDASDVEHMTLIGRISR